MVKISSEKLLNLLETSSGENLEAYTVMTGYVRELLSKSDKKVTEITYHGIVSTFLCPQAEAIIYIGGQDSKVILLNKNEKVRNFLMMINML